MYDKETGWDRWPRTSARVSAAPKTIQRSNNWSRASQTVMFVILGDQIIMRNQTTHMNDEVGWRLDWLG